MDVYCIHLPKRTDRLTHLQKLQAKYPAVSVRMVDAISHENGVIGCHLSHKKCIQMAKDKGLPYVIVIEDDCDFLLSNERLKKCLHTMIEYHSTHPEVEIINGCGNLSPFVITSLQSFGGMQFLRSPGVLTTHFIFYTASVYDRILEANPETPIDVILNTHRMVYTHPYLATQIASYSNIQNADVTYDNIDRSRVFVEKYVRSVT
jgi:hypothetical protein